MALEEKTFDNEKELVKYLEEVGICSEEILDTLSHERTHINRARELGYEHKGYRILREICNVRTDINVSDIEVIPIFEDDFYNNKNFLHIKDIALAPKNPGKRDIETARICLEHINFKNILENLLGIYKEI